MTQVKCRTAGGKGLTQAAWKYVMRREIAMESLAKRIENKEKARKNITLSKLKWMDRPF